jgi:uncharacterized protein YgbK (DUF1537 family)
VIDLPNEAQLLDWSRGYQAVVLAVGTRSVAPELARQRTRAAIALLQIRQPQQFFIKYCSTFDSTPAGNIGPTIDAALTALNEEFTVAVPAFGCDVGMEVVGVISGMGSQREDSPWPSH